MYIYIKIIAWANFCFITKSEGKTILWMHRQIITMTSLWARWRLKSPASPFGSLSRLFGRRSKNTSKLRVTGLCEGNSPGTGESPHKWQVTRKMFPFDDVIMFLPEWKNATAPSASMPTSTAPSAFAYIIALRSWNIAVWFHLQMYCNSKHRHRNMCMIM